MVKDFKHFGKPPLQQAAAADGITPDAKLAADGKSMPSTTAPNIGAKSALLPDPWAN